MVKEQVIGSYIIRFTKSNNRMESSLKITLQDIKTGEQLEFETWLAAWAFLESILENQDDTNSKDLELKSKFMAKVLSYKASNPLVISMKDVDNIRKDFGGSKEIMPIV